LFFKKASKGCFNYEERIEIIILSLTFFITIFIFNMDDKKATFTTSDFYPLTGFFMEN
jgi:hypothetical protein